MTETLTSLASFEQIIKKSRFLATVTPISTVEDAKAFLQAHSVSSANHNCWAYRLGDVYRFSDDGEPSGTGGKPILQAIDGQGLDGVAVVVTRWFGGVLLGAGGLIRAYGGTAAACLRSAPRRPVIKAVRHVFHVGFSDLALVKARLTAVEHLTIAAEAYDGEGCRLTIDMPAANASELCREMVDITGGRLVVESDG